MIDIKKLIEQKKAIIGEQRVLKAIAKEQVKEVLISKNINETTKKKIFHYTKLLNVPVTELEENSQILAEICKKPFNINVIGII
ncbi:ribosomal L7Ae/L30e/S12e/Gadd45 family protein [Candidatus Woesearchaeota archaeon]|nr:ribosomal L7Ae/L30e/S12e/Gadd45 family protein [Candidatus Woesearchaeota archaeon]